MNPIIFTVSPPGPTPPMTINLTALLDQFRTVPDQRTRRGVRYPLPVLLTIAVLAKLCGHSQMHAVADWATARAGELATLFGLPRPQMPHPTTWTRVFGTGVRATAVETALAPLLAAPPTHMVPPVPRSTGVPPRFETKVITPGVLLGCGLMLRVPL